MSGPNKCDNCGDRLGDWGHGLCATCAKKAEEERRVARDAEHVRWHRSTGHCGACGQPGTFCLCTDRQPCGCRDLHQMGSGIGVDGALLFADEPSVMVGDDQQELFG